MKKMMSLLLGLCIAGTAFADVHVNGYYRKDGTYVQPHYRTNPNSTVNDNYSTYPNVNPYNGNTGTRQSSYGISSSYGSSSSYGLNKPEPACTENGVAVDC